MTLKVVENNYNNIGSQKSVNQDEWSEHEAEIPTCVTDTMRIMNDNIF